MAKGAHPAFHVMAMNLLVSRVEVHGERKDVQLITLAERPWPNVDDRQAFPQARNLIRRGPISRRPQNHRAGPAVNVDNHLNRAADRLTYNLDTVHTTIDEVIAPATELRGQCLAASFRIREEEAQVLARMAQAVATAPDPPRAKTEARTTTSTTSLSVSTFKDPLSGLSTDDLLVRIQLLIVKADHLPPIETVDCLSLSARFTKLQELLKFYNRFLTRLENSFIDYDARAGARGRTDDEPRVVLGHIDIVMSKQDIAPTSELQRFVSLKDLELKPKGKAISEPGSNLKQPGKGKGKAGGSEV
ncbi:hypothetical protein BDV93DRAFT_565556 [Ceratobasidium sp. AG-I]|nr:hypothetical protein BDV93DRAFT_565556 [Ceratobasidium sp. AG-I]